MPVRVVHVGNMWIPVAKTPMTMPMRVRFAGRIIRAVLMLVVGIVDVAVCMLHWQMFMLVLVFLAEMEPNANGHQNTGGRKLGRDRLM